ncbi:MAG: PAS domain-containing protein, partial [Proteobacteria bacterium]
MFVKFLPVLNSSDLILENLLDAVIIVNQQGIILYANRAAEKLFQKETSFLKGQNFGLSVTALELQQIQIVQKGKNLSIEMLATDIAWQGEQAILMSLRDVTEKAKLELKLQKSNRLLTKKTAALKKVNEALEKSNDSLERFAHVTSHDLKEPLRKIRVFSGRLTNEFQNQLPDRSLVYINKIVQSADRLLAMVDGILSYSSLLGMEESMETIDLNNVIKNIKNDLELMITQRHARIE